jgi:hypothetical protein
MTDGGNFLRRPDGQTFLHDPSDTVDRATGGVYRRRHATLNPDAAQAAQGVNIFGRALGAMGLDDTQGSRRNTPWSTAWQNTHQGLSLANTLQSAFGAADRLLTETPAGHQDPTNPLLGFEVAGTLGGTAAPTAMLGGMPRGAVGTFGSGGTYRYVRPRAEGRPAALPPPIDPDDVVRHLGELGAANVRVHRSGGNDGTLYVRFESPDNPRPPGTPYPTVRIPVDQERHVGNRPKTAERGNLFDTGISSPAREGHPASTFNAGGGSYADWENLAAALRWRLSRSPDGQWLVSPDQAPQGLREASLVDPRLANQWVSQLPPAVQSRFTRAQRRAQRAADAPEPTQLQLLSAGVPTPSALAEFLQSQSWPPHDDAQRYPYP